MSKATDIPEPPQGKVLTRARLDMRVGAFLLDISLIVATLMLIQAKFLAPQKFAITGSEYSESQQYLLTLFTFIFWLYFFISELFMKGATLGKKVFKLYAINTRTGAPVAAFESSFRSVLKAITFFGFPILTVNYLIPFFTKSRRAGHDLICKTHVIEDDRIPQKTENRDPEHL